MKTKTETKVKQITVDLEKIHNPCEALVQTYADAHAEDLFAFDKNNKSEYVNERNLFLSVGKKPIKHNLFGLYRKQIGTKEYCFFFDMMVGSDYFQNKLTWTRIIGRWERPIITQRHGLDPNSLKSDSRPEPGPMGDPEIDSFEEVYDYEFSSLRDQLLKWKEQGLIHDKSIFYVVIGNRKYSAPFSFEQWLNLSIPDLQLIGEHGKKFTGLMSAQDPKTLQIIKETIQAEISKSMLNPPK